MQYVLSSKVQRRTLWTVATTGILCALASILLVCFLSSAATAQSPPTNSARGGSAPTIQPSKASKTRKASKTNEAKDCPISYALPHEIKTYLAGSNTAARNRQTVRWKISCTQTDPVAIKNIYGVRQKICRISPLAPHRMLCFRSVLETGQERLTLIRALASGLSHMTYTVAGANGFRLQVEARVKARSAPREQEKIVALLLKVAKSVRLNGQTARPTGPRVTKIVLRNDIESKEQTSVSANAEVDTGTNAPAAGCPYSFNVPDRFIASIHKTFKDGTSYTSGKQRYWRWARSCGTSHQAHFAIVLGEENCLMAPASPQFRFCGTGVRWPGVDKVIMSVISGQTSVQYLAYTPTDQWLFHNIVFDKDTPAPVMQSTLLDLLALAASVRLKKHLVPGASLQ